jgi:glycosyltransferase involved in cell wall biosynthesis
VTSPGPLLSIVIPAYRAEAHLGRCLDALAPAAQTAEEGRWEVIVVDDLSPDGTAALAEARGARVVRHERNRGAAAARNTGAAAAQGEILLFVDSDVVPAPGIVAGTLAAFEAASTVAATGRYDPEPANETAFAHYKALWTFWNWEITGAATGESGHLQGALAAMRKDVFEAIGGFDEAYQGGNVEDYELSSRLREAGHRIVFDDRLRGRHHFPGFTTVARNYWDRTRMWIRLRPELKGFSSGQASKRSGVAAILAASSALGHLALPILWPIAPFVAAVDVGWLIAASPFLRWVRRERGLKFALYATAVHYSLSVVIGLAAASSPLGEGTRRR